MCKTDEVMDDPFERAMHRFYIKRIRKVKPDKRQRQLPGFEDAPVKKKKVSRRRRKPK